MNKFGFVSCISTLLFSSLATAEFRANFDTLNLSYPLTLHVPRTAPINTYLGTMELGTFSPWSWWNVTGATEVGIYLSGLSGNAPKIPGYGYVRELKDSGIGYVLYGLVNGPCHGAAYVDGLNIKDGNISNRIICTSYDSTANSSVTLKAVFFKISHQVKTQVIPSTRAAMFVLLNNNQFITNDVSGKMEPKVMMSAVNVISTGCEVKSKTVDVPFGKINKASFSGVGSRSPESQRHFQIDLDCDPKSPIKIKFIGTGSSPHHPGTIALNNPQAADTAKGYGIQIRFTNRPIKLNKKMTIVRSNAFGQYSIPLEASYIQTQATTTAGKANGTLQFNLQYH